MSEADNPGKNPFDWQELPDWLVSIHMDVKKPKLVSVADGKAVSSGLLISALTARIGTTIGSFAISPEDARAVAQFTENPAWMNLPAEGTSITRLAQDSWEITVGDFKGSFDGETLGSKLREVLQTPSEDQETS